MERLINVSSESSDKEKWRNCIGLMIRLLHQTAIEVRERIGDIGEEMLKDTIRKNSREICKEILDILKLEKRDTRTLAECIKWHDENIFGLEEEIPYASENKTILKAKYCPLHASGFTKEDCERFGHPVVLGFIDEINPKLKWIPEKRLTQGDDCCEWYIELEEKA